MDVALVVAIIRTHMLEAVKKKLQEIGVRGITVTKAKGFGQQSLSHDILGRELTEDQLKLEIYVASDQAERIASSIVDAAHTGSPGDGIVVILPVQRAFSVQTRSQTIPNRARG